MAIRTTQITGAVVKVQKLVRGEWMLLVEESATSRYALLLPQSMVAGARRNLQRGESVQVEFFTASGDTKLIVRYQRVQKEAVQ